METYKIYNGAGEIKGYVKATNEQEAMAIFSEKRPKTVACNTLFADESKVPTYCADDMRVNF